MNGLVWLRNDIRMDDNPGLRKACEECDTVLAIYLWSPEQLNRHNEANIKVEFLIKNLQSLEENLNSINIPILVIDNKDFSSVDQNISNLIKEHSIDKVYWGKEFGFDEINRDKSVEQQLIESKIDFETFNDQIIYEPGFLRTGQDNPFSVFTPFKRRWVENFDMKFLDIEFNYPVKNKLEIQSNISNFDFNFSSKHSVDMNLWPAGETNALIQLNDFLDNRAINYSKDRNDPILNGTSRISPYLACGVISSRRCILEGLKRNNFELTSGNTGITKWIDEIVWREFYRNIMFSFSKVSRGKPFQDYTKNIQWQFNKDKLDAWKHGQTGFPLIDAAMRQLLHEGWMHNRLRMVVAMFFTKNMLHDWRLGEAYFMQNLIDGDFASNNGGWQWSSSTGTDAAPYFRIFNPITQSKNFDKEGLFIKKYVPELKDLDKSEIHDPSKEIRKHLNYPLQILDLKESRLRAIDVFNAAKNSS
ncbi:DNA photolyase family protein [Gammaproteobacteria bacterium]|nr:DNA photolyase family protein [Gammaproteobacteria bacterium]